MNLYKVLFVFFIYGNVFADNLNIKIFLPNNRYLISYEAGEFSFQSNKVFFKTKNKKCLKEKVIESVSKIKKINKIISGTFKGIKNTIEYPALPYSINNNTYYISKDAHGFFEMIEQIEVDVHRLMNFEKIRCTD